MKRRSIVALMLAISLLFTTGIAAYADEEQGQGQEDERQPDVNPADLQKDYEIPGNGYIGLDDDGGGDYKDLIKVHVPEEFNWYVNNNSTVNSEKASEIQSFEYKIINESTDVSLKVKLVSFTQTNNVVIPGELDLRLKGDLGKEGIENTNIIGYNNGLEYTEIFEPGDEWEFTFGGTYKGSFPAIALRPTYNMVLNFSIHEVGLEPAAGTN